MATPAAILNILVDVNSGAATAQLTQLNSQMKATAVTANTTSTAIGTKLTRAAKIGGVALAGGLAYGLYKAVDAGVSFEKQMDSVGAVADASAKQMNRLREQALKLGQDTAYSASQAAEAQGELVKGGIKVKDVIGGALPAALSLAAAGEIDLASAAETTANAMQLFGLQGKQASHVSDLLATAANKTTADVEDFAMALKQGGAVAKLAGYDIDQTVTTLEALAAAGIKNSDAGTSMKTAFIQLLKPTEKQAALTKQLGLSFITQNGEMKDAAAISKQLQAATDGMTKAERARTFATLAGTDGVRTLSALYDAGPALLKKYADANREVGTAQDIAREKMDNTAGSIEQLKGSLETLGIRVFEVIGPPFRDAVDLATKGVTALGNANFNKLTHDETLRQLVDVIGDLGRISKWTFEKVIQPVLKPTLKVFIGLTKGVIGMVQIITGLLTGDFRQAWEGVKNIFKGGVDAIIGTFQASIAPVRTIVDTVAHAIGGPLKKVWHGISAAFRSGTDFILGTFTSILDGMAKLADAGSKIPGPVGDMWDTVQAGAEDAADSINKFREELRGSDKAIRDSGAQITSWRKNARRNFRDGVDAVGALGHGFKLFDQDSGRALAGAGRNLDRYGRNLDRSEDKTRDFRRDAGGNFTGLSDVIGNALSVIGNNTNKILGSLGAKKLQFSALQKARIAQGDDARGLQGGGLVPGTGSGDKVPLHLGGRLAAMVEPGEYVSVANRNATAALMATNAAVPRFASGGVIQQALGPYDMPPIVADPNHGSAGFNSHLHLDFFTKQQALAYGHKMQGMGWTIGEYTGSNPYGFGPVTVRHQAPGHYDGTAFDANTAADETRDEVAAVVRMLGGAAVGGAAQKIARLILKGPDGPMKNMGQAAIDKATKAANAYIAKHMPTDMGPSIGPPVDVKNLPPSLQKYNYRWEPHWAPDWTGPQMPVDKVAMLAEWAGAPGVTMAQVAHGESNYRPGAAGHDANGYSTGYGLWAITTGVGNDAEINKYGGPEAMWNPITNAMIMGAYYKRAGLQPWTGTRFLTDPNAHYTGPMRKHGGIVAKLAEGGLLAPATLNAMKPSTPGAYPLPGGGEVFGGPVVSDMTESIMSWLGPTARAKRDKKDNDYEHGVKRIKGYIDDLGIKKGMLNELKDQAGRIALLSENADAASALGSAVGGKSQIDWLKEQLEAMFEYRWMLIKVEAAAKGRARDVARFVRKLEHEIKRMEKVVSRNKEREKEYQDAVKKAKGKDAKEAAENRLKAFQAILGGQEAKLGLLKGLVLPGVNRELSGLKGQLDTEGEGAAGLLQTLQGIRATKRKLRFTEPYGAELGLLKGDILSTQITLRDALTGDTENESGSVLADLLRQQLAGSRRENALLRAQMPVFQSMVPYMGAFAAGGVALVGESGPELASLPSGTRITSAAETQAMLEPEVALILNGCTIDTHGQTLAEAVKVAVNGELREIGRVNNRRTPTKV